MSTRMHTHWLITATNHDGSFRQWAQPIDLSEFRSDPEFLRDYADELRTCAAISALTNDPHKFNPGHSAQLIGPKYNATPL